MAKIKYRKCPECGGKMVVRKSGKGNKFWGCTMWKENDCRGSAEYFGPGARAGFNLVIREIENGFIITTSSPYASVNEEPTELYVKDKTELAESLEKIMQNQVSSLCKEIEDTSEFTDEIDHEKHEARVKIVKRGVTDIDALLKKMAEAKAKEIAGEKAVSPE